MGGIAKKITSLKANVMGRYLWLKILASGVVLFILLERALAATDSINYIPSLLVVGTFTVPLAFVAFLYTRNKTPHVSASSLLVCVVWGGIMGTVLAGVIEYHTLLHLGVLPTVFVGLIEEATKLIVPAWLIFGRNTYSEVDSIVIGATVGAGFAALESMGYGLIALLLTGGDITATTEVLLVRALMAPAAHIAWTALAADALWHVRQRASSHAMRRLAYTFSGVVLLHALWDSAAFAGGLWFIVLGIVSLGWLLVRIRRASNEAGFKLHE
jgi:RsiW-degrading membrane proteinase PrsW (M82 family)